VAQEVVQGGEEGGMQRIVDILQDGGLAGQRRYTFPAARMFADSLDCLGKSNIGTPLWFNKRQTPLSCQK
jgi:hypothetical protein